MYGPNTRKMVQMGGLNKYRSNVNGQMGGLTTHVSVGKSLFSCMHTVETVACPTKRHFYYVIMQILNMFNIATWVVSFHP